MSKIPDDIAKEMIDWCRKEYDPNYSGYTILIPAIEHGYSLALERIGELEEENKEHIENVNTLAKMQSESMGWLVESEKKVKELEKETERLRELIDIGFKRAYNLSRQAVDIDGGYYSEQCLAAFKTENNLNP